MVINYSLNWDDPPRRKNVPVMFNRKCIFKMVDIPASHLRFQEEKSPKSLFDFPILEEGRSDLSLFPLLRLASFLRPGSWAIHPLRGSGLEGC